MTQQLDRLASHLLPCSPDGQDDEGRGCAADEVEVEASDKLFVTTESGHKCVGFGSELTAAALFIDRKYEHKAL